MDIKFHDLSVCLMRRRARAILGLLATLEALDETNYWDSVDYAELLASLAADFGLKSANLVPFVMGFPPSEWLNEDEPTD